ncbi:hypothetical protein LX97_01194 [Nonlabens dokdonensis]|uniref:Uncharacterized protein n=2 Tax=Nonlabens dokdonensis TaxID=328515 RepID=L7W8Q3_NONDD|nr:hypothetical protein [Nonlabens dokdonensis]AGC76534.1 hypothetical protein DDD_1407 [Nonlabens dokdonensis DSW-6]PZX44185.1 hypothetical protein LX97_01194 [Nonlabens dokdonensis]
MKIKKPLLSTYIFAGILLAGIVVLYILTSAALNPTSATTNNSTYTEILHLDQNV